MPKELIVSVNGREKKIAIIEDGRVTEFYIERGEGTQGIVGNIYKGRVMRVLPGMQSAFVDIGLERDAFLYVTDFFDEEEEFERIVVDKTKSEGVDAEAAARAAAERIERSRIERERQMEAAQERAEPEGGAAAVEDDEDETDDEADDETTPVAAQAPAEEVAAPQVARGEADAFEAEGGRGGRKRERGRGRGGREREAGDESRAASGGARGRAPREGRVEAGAGRGRLAPEDVATPFSAGESSFQRVVDEDNAAVEEGSMFKDARVQERLTDQIRGVEFDMESTPTVEVGSLLQNAGASARSSFQRVDDGDDAGESGSRGVRSVQPEVTASVARLVDDFEDEGPAGTLAGGQQFERVSDDEKETESPAAGAAEKGARKKAASPAAKGAAKKGSKKGAAASKSAAKKASPATAASKKKAPTKDAGRRKKSGVLNEADKETRQEAANADSDAAYKDADARLKSTPARGEFARRGGRRRRGGGSNGGSGEGGGERGPQGGTPSEDRPADGHDEEAVAVTKTQGPAAETASAPQERAAPAQERPAQQERPPARGRGRRDEGRRDEPRRDEGRRDEPRRDEPRRDDGRRDESRRTDGRRDEGKRDEAKRDDGKREEGRRDDPGRSSSGGGGGRGNGRERGGRDRGRDRGHPTITDLLREGQEIIVQIAKEPIAQKGARITSHIALPGRFLVYMPTIEHVGVSRKIESDSERVRLRKLIQKIVQEEDVPSGGFIVRTAGVGISEQDLRDDARYLIRTWLDIRRNAEKQKAPSISHKDLDLVQRILRDQLSEDFTAIRIDNEEEYLDVVEFVNRIQPRLVNRVKFYTRETPILEAYGVDAEIEKAIKPRVWLKSGGYLVINQTEALVAIDVNTGKFVGRGGSRLEDTITRTNMEAVDEIARQIRLRDLGGIIVLDLIDMEERRNRARVLQALQDALREDKSPTKVLSFNDFGLIIMTRKRVKQSLERTLCSPCPYCQGSSLVKSPQTVCYEILEEARRLSRSSDGEQPKQTTLRVNTEVARALRSTERDVLAEIEDFLGAIDVTSDAHIHQEQFDFAYI